MDVAEAIVMLMKSWGFVGAVVALAFLSVGIDRIDEDARGAYIFRPLLIPGILILWPLVLWRWWQIETERAAWMDRYRPVRAGHGPAVVVMSILIVLSIALGLVVRQEWPADIAPVELSGGAGE